MILLLILLSQVQPSQVTILWDPNTETDLAGYKVYVGTAPGTYGPPIDLPGTPTNPTYTVTNLLRTTRYYFAVTAYNTSGLESGFSNEVTTILFPTKPSGLIVSPDQLVVNLRR